MKALIGIIVAGFLSIYTYFSYEYDIYAFLEPYKAIHDLLPEPIKDYDDHLATC